MIRALGDDLDNDAAGGGDTLAGIAAIGKKTRSIKGKISARGLQSPLCFVVSPRPNQVRL
jgi:hypothetical protein